MSLQLLFRTPVSCVLLVSGSLMFHAGAGSMGFVK